jgi:hypothetical protein
MKGPVGPCSRRMTVASDGAESQRGRTADEWLVLRRGAGLPADAPVLRRKEVVAPKKASGQAGHLQSLRGAVLTSWIPA